MGAAFIDDLKALWRAACIQSAKPPCHAENLCGGCRLYLRVEKAIADLERQCEEARKTGHRQGRGQERERLASYIERTFGRLNLLTANGYLNGDDVAAKIRAGKL